VQANLGGSLPHAQDGGDLPVRELLAVAELKHGLVALGQAAEDLPRKPDRVVQREDTRHVDAIVLAGDGDLPDLRRGSLAAALRQKEMVGAARAGWRLGCAALGHFDERVDAWQVVVSPQAARTFGEHGAAY
jgi:hypothetical protein